jgi:ornithine cyclodeaminase/alanine dehydrogenase-like protein (mu-crystallin family)
MHPSDYLEAVRTGLIAAPRGRAQVPPPLHLAALGGGFHAKAALLDDPRPVVALKLNANFPDNPARGLPTIQGAVLLCDALDGRLLAILDSIELTLRRTAAATALAARCFARADAATLAVCGCGAQAVAQIEALLEVLPIRRVVAWDIVPERARGLGEALASRSGLAFETSDSVEVATRAADVIVTCTTARTPFLRSEHVAPGSFVAAVGTDAPDKSELTPGLMAAGQVIVDSLDQCLAMGDLHHAVAAGAMTAGDVHAELGAVLAGDAAGRSTEEETWIFDSTGTALQDVASALAAYDKALVEGAGTLLSLG